MDVLYYLVPMALFLAGLFVVAFRWAARTDQFEDLDTPAIRILLDDEKAIDRSSQNKEEEEDKKNKSLLSEKALSEIDGVEHEKKVGVER